MSKRSLLPGRLPPAGAAVERPQEPPPPPFFSHARRLSVIRLIVWVFW